MRKRIVSVVLGFGLVLVAFATAPAAYAQVTSDEYNELLTRADRLIRNERRYQDALEVLRKAYDARPTPNVLALIGTVYMALGMQTEAEDALNRALAEGGVISLEVGHHHLWKSCFGTLYISREEIRWVSRKKRKDNFRVVPTEIQKVRSFESVTSKEYREQSGGAIPELTLRALKKNWRFEYLLYGPGKYRVTDAGQVLYYGDDLRKVERSTSVIIQVLRAAGSPLTNPQLALEREVRIGKRLAGEMERRAELLDDPIVAEYVYGVVQNIVRHSDARVPFAVKVLNSDTLEFVVLPGGFLYVSKGVILLLKDEAELAALMGHAVGHVAARHHAKHYLEGTSSLDSFFETTLSSAEEAQADLLGLQYMFKAGYDPTSYVAAAEKVREAQRQQVAPIPERFVSHVLTPDRIRKAQQMARLFPPREESVVTSSGFDMVRQRVAESSRERTAQDVELPTPMQQQLKDTQPARESPALSEIQEEAGTHTRIEIQPGMSKDEVLKVLGAPQREIVFGNKTILRYADITVELVDNKVVEVKAN